MAPRIAEGGLDDPRVVAPLRTHLARSRAETAPGSAHGFAVCGPFGAYRKDPNSMFLMLDLRAA